MKTRGRDKASPIVKTFTAIKAAQTVVELAGAVAKLRDARAAANRFAAISKDPAGRQLLALAIGGHVVAMRRLQAQLEAPPKISIREIRVIRGSTQRQKSCKIKLEQLTG